MTLKKTLINTMLIPGLILGVALLAGINLTPLRVNAQSGAQLVIDPALININPGNLAYIDLKVIDEVRVNAFDLKVTYNPAVLSLESWTLGDYLSNLAQVKKVQEPGLLRLVYTQLATPPVSGDGILLQLVFKGIGVGNATVGLETVSFADPEGNLTYPQLTNGVIIVQSNVSPTTTPTTTPTLTQIIPGITETVAIVEPTSTGSPDPNNLITEQAITATDENQGSNETLPGATTMIDTSTIIVTDGNSEAGSSQTGDQPIEQAGTNETDDQSDLLNKYLWGILILSVIILLAMIIIAIKRKNTEHLKEW